VNNIIIITLLILTTCFGCASNGNKKFTYLADDTDYCSPSNITCEDVVMKNKSGKLEVYKKASCLSEYDYIEVKNIISGVTEIMYGQKHRVDIMTFQVDCIAKVINIEKF
jgi:hypothetical protein